jgi:hypothetical protein
VALGSERCQGAAHADKKKDGKMKVYPDKSFLISMKLQTVDLILG